MLHYTEHCFVAHIHTFLAKISGKVGITPPVAWEVVQKFFTEVCGVSKPNTEHQDLILTLEVWQDEQVWKLRRQLLAKALSFAFGAKLVRISYSHKQQIHRICKTPTDSHVLSSDVGPCVRGVCDGGAS
jgi:hypothetical protein